MSEAETIDQIELLKRTLTALGVQYADHDWRERFHLTLETDDGDLVYFNFKNGKFVDVEIWKP